jgi:heme-degrading monooxygenase HmoA
MSWRKLALPVALLAVGYALHSPGVAEPTEKATMYELRTYTCNPGKLDELNKRFREHTTKLFEKHGIKNIGYWVPVETPDTLIYIIAHPNREAWKAFLNDPDWKAAKAKSEENGSLVKSVKSQFMTATDYSPIK